MNRLLMVAILGLWICGCETTSPSSYIYYEVVHSSEQVSVGDSLLIETSDGATFQGILLRADEEEIVVTTERQGEGPRALARGSQGAARYKGKGEGVEAGFKPAPERRYM